MTLLERLAAGPCLLLDGGMGSMLMERGLPAGTPPEAWNVERPDAVTAVHRAYVEAGSDVVHANTFGGNPLRLGLYGLDERCEELNSAAVRCARDSGAAFVLGDMGPSGQYLPPVGAADEGAWREAFERQAAALAGAHVDAIHIETMSDLREAKVALTAARATAPELPVWVSLTFDRKKRGFFTLYGDRPLQAFTELAELGAAAVGANCSITSPQLRELASELGDEPGLALVLQPNAGQPVPTAAGVRYEQSPVEFAGDMAALAAGGAAAVGGCCGTDPEFIRRLRQTLDAAAS